MSEPEDNGDEQRQAEKPPFSVMVDIDDDLIVLAFITRLPLENAEPLLKLLSAKCDQLRARRQVTKSIIIPGVDTPFNRKR